MFETVVPEQFVKRNRAPLYEALPLSIAFHALIAGVALASHVWTVAFPDQAPAQAMSFNLAEIPPPPPPPPPPPKPLAQQIPPQKIVQMPKEIVAPSFIPEEIPEILPVSVVSEVVDASPQGVEGGIEGGELGGIMGGSMGGEVGGVLGGTQGGVVTEP